VFVNIGRVVLNEECKIFVRNWKDWRSGNSLDLYLCGTIIEARSTLSHPAQGLR